MSQLDDLLGGLLRGQGPVHQASRRAGKAVRPEAAPRR
jgi:hypothetical protein